MMSVATGQKRTKQQRLVPRWTVEQYLALSEDDEKSELIDGVLIVSPSPGSWHQDITHRLLHLLERWVYANNLGQIWFDLDMVLDEKCGIVYRPDLVYLSKPTSTVCGGNASSAQPTCVWKSFPPAINRRCCSANTRTTPVTVCAGTGKFTAGSRTGNCWSMS
jgi:Uma2 family endonuclease